MDSAGTLMELSEQRIRAQYDGAFALLKGFQHAPRIARARSKAPSEASAGLGTRRTRFRPTTPGLVAGGGAARPDGVHLLDRIEAADGGDPLISPAQAAVAQALRRAIAVSRAMVESFEEQTPLGALKRDNLKGRLPPQRRGRLPAGGRGRRGR